MLAFEDIPHRRPANVMSQFEQFPVELAVSPARVLFGEPEDQGFHVSGNRRSAPTLVTREPPLVSDQLAVPLEQGVGLEHQHGLR